MESYSVPIQFEESDTEYESDDSDSKYDGLDSIERFELDYDNINNTCQKYLKVLSTLPSSNEKDEIERLLKEITKSFLDAYEELIDVYYTDDNEKYNFINSKVEAADIMFQHITNTIIKFIKKHQ
jgi:CHASE3 domain sensor protein